MGKINFGRVIAGGLLAGLIINVGEFVLNGLILDKDWEEAMRVLGKPPIGSSAIVIFLALGFVLGILMVWLYAAIRPRCGAGPKTAICAGLITYALGYLYPGAGQLVIGLFPIKLQLIGLAWGLVEIVLAAVAGTWLYKEEA